MKRFIPFVFIVLLISFCSQCFGQEDKAYPKIEYFVNDYAGLLTYEQIAGFEPVLKEIYDS